MNGEGVQDVPVSVACTAEGVVGLNGSWYCLDHFDIRLKEIGYFIKRMRGMFSATMQPADGSIVGNPELGRLQHLRTRLLPNS